MCVCVCVYTYILYAFSCGCRPMGLSVHSVRIMIKTSCAIAGAGSHCPGEIATVSWRLSAARPEMRAR